MLIMKPYTKFSLPGHTLPLDFNPGDDDIKFETASGKQGISTIDGIAGFGRTLLPSALLGTDVEMGRSG